MRIGHGCFNVFVTQELLKNSNIVSPLQKMRSEGVSKRVARHPLCQFSGGDRFFHSFLDQRLIRVMSPPLSSFQVLPAFALVKGPLPFHSCVRILSVKGIRHPTVNPFLLSAHYKVPQKTHRFGGNISIHSANKCTFGRKSDKNKTSRGASDCVMKCLPLRRHRVSYSNATPFHGSPGSWETIRS